jgi:tetratricopeptide (TPR) repeat protein
MAIALNYKNAYCYHNRGLAYIKMGQIDQAIFDYTISLELSSMYSHVFSDRGVAYYYKDQYDKACSDWKRACELGLCANYAWAKLNRICQ